MLGDKRETVSKAASLDSNSSSDYHLLKNLTIITFYHLYFAPYSIIILFLWYFGSISVPAWKRVSDGLKNLLADC